VVRRSDEAEEFQFFSFSSLFLFFGPRAFVRNLVKEVSRVKFLIVQKVKREVALEKWAKLLPLQFKYFEKLEKERALEVYYHLVGQQGSMLVVNVDSDEALSKFIGQDPLFFYLEREIYPLTTRQTHEKQIRQLLKE
jgi:muconolactone delta-isomerase